MEIKHSINYFLRKDWKIRIIEILPFLIMDAFYLRLYLGNRKMLLTYGDTYTLTAGDCLRPALSAVYLVFALMIALSFFAFYRFQAVGTRDFIKFYSEKKVYLKTFLYLERLHLLIFVNISALVSSFYLLSCQFRADYFLQIMRNLACWYGLLPLLAILIGLFLSYMKSYQGIIIAYILILLVSSPLVNAVCRSISFNTGVNTSGILKYFKLMPLPRYDIASTIAYLGTPVTFDAVWLLLLWIFLFCLGILLISGHRCRYLYAFNGGMCILCFLCLLNIPHSSRIEYGDINEGSEHNSYYYLFQDKENTAEALLSEQDYGIQCYHIDLRVRDGIQANVTIDITDTNQSEYLFTLYHTYKLEGITDQNGDALEYSRFDDYIRISSHAPVSQFVFQYSGSAPGACTNSEGIHLSSYFPFYPMQGIQAVYYSYTDSYLDHQMSDKTPFYVHVDSTKQVYCNLPEVSHNTFAGTETGFFLLSGFVETYKYKDITVLYPYNGKASTSYDEWNRAIDSLLELEQEYDSDHSNHIQYIMIERGFSASRLYTYGSNYAEVATLTTTHMMQIDGYSVPDEPEGYALYKHYLETGHNEINSYFYN